MTQAQSQSDPIARLALFGLMALVCVAFVAPGVQASTPAQIIATPAPIIVYRVATPTAGLPDPPAAPVVLIQPTEAPPPTPAPAVIEQAPVVVEAPAPVVEQAPVVAPQPAPPEPPATAVPEPQQELASGVVVVQTKQQFIDSFAAPPTDAKCAFVGCLSAP